MTPQGQGRSRFTLGLPPSELWGVSQGYEKRKRGEAARERRRLKKAAKRAKARLKAWIKKQGLKP